MRSKWSALTAAAVIVIGALGCGGESERRPDPDAGVVLRLDRAVTEPGATLALTVENRRRNSIEFGLAYRLERRAGGGWKWLNKDDFFALIAIGVQPGKSYEQKVRLPGDLAPGSYRIAKTITAGPNRRELDVVTPLRVE